MDVPLPMNWVDTQENVARTDDLQMTDEGLTFSTVSGDEKESF